MALAFTLVMTSFGYAPEAFAATDTVGPSVDLSSIQLSTQMITDIYKGPKVKVKVTDQSEVADVTLFYRVGEGNVGGNAILEYNKKTGLFEGEVQYDARDPEKEVSVGFYGNYELYWIVASDVYGNYTYVENFEAPNGNFKVVGGNPEDKALPVVDCERIVVDKVVKKGATAVVTVPIADDSKILNATVFYTSPQGGTAFAYLKDKGNGKYQTTLSFETEGEYQLESIYVVDANCNYLYIRNSEHFEYQAGSYGDDQIHALGHADITYGQYVAPKPLSASIKSIELSSEIINKNEAGTVTITFDASAPLKTAGFSYDYVFERGNTSYESGGTVTKIDDYTFQFTLPSIYYGQWRMNNMGVTDYNGSSVLFYDPAQSELEKGVAVDLSDAAYYVGIVDPETGLGVSDSAFDDTTKLEVEEESLNSELYHDMISDDSTGVAMYDVDVEGNRDEETALSIVAPDGFVDGDKVEVVHQRHDGSNETFEAEVKHGRITIETDEFSPFLVQVDKEHEHRYSAKKMTKKATFSKGGTYQKKCYACDAVSGTAKLKPAKASLTKDRVAYTGSKIGSKKLPKVVVKDAKGNVIHSRYYTVTKPKNEKAMKAIGRYPYKITFKKSCKEYTGTKTVYLEITPNKVGLSSVKGAKKAVTVKWKKGKKAQVTGYQILVATNSKFTKNVKTVNVKGYQKTSVKAAKLKAKTKYYAKVRTYKTVKGIKIYSDWSKVKTVKTR